MSQDTNLQKGTFESFDNTKIYYEVHGNQGPALVFIYGIVCTMNHWKYQVKDLSAKYRVVLMDLRGHHFSQIPSDKSLLSTEAIASDIIAMCEHLGIEKAHFIGHSYGCQVLLNSYLQKPNLFLSYIGINAFFSNPFERHVESGTLKEILTIVRKIHNFSPNIMSNLWKYGATHPISVWISSLIGGFNFDETPIQDIEIYAQGVANVDVRVFITLFEQLTQSDYQDKLKEFNTKSLLLIGEVDSLTIKEDQINSAKNIPMCESHVIEGGSHSLQLDFPDKVNEIIENFVNS